VTLSPVSVLGAGGVQVGAILNFSFIFAGSAGVNPAMIVVSMFVILAWRNAGWFGLDRFVLPRLGTPWCRGELFGAGGSGTPGC
jgi:thiosulfate dehydrogenase (quinone) large subunit